MSLPLQPNSVVGTRLLDLLSTRATSNEVATFGYSNGQGVRVRLYDNNNPATGLLLGYNSSNATFSFTRETTNLSFGINTASPATMAHVIGNSIVTGTFTTSNLTVSGASATSSAINTVNNLIVALYQPSGTDSTQTSYKNIITNDTTYSNRILFSTLLSADKYLLNLNIPYKNNAASFTLGSFTIGLYATTPDLFNPTTQTPLVSQNVDLLDTTQQSSISFNMYLSASTTNYVIAVSGIGDSIQFGGNSRPCILNTLSTTTLGTNQTYNARQPLASSAIQQTFIPNQTTSTFSIISSNVCRLSSPQNAEIYKNGLKLIYYSSASNDYSISYTNTATLTQFTITMVTPVLSGSVVDITLWPDSITSNVYEPKYLYQTVYNNWVGSRSINVASNTTNYVGINTYSAPQPLSVVGQSYFSSNVGFGVTYPNATVDILDQWNDGTTTMNIQQSIVGQEFPPVGISNIYFAPDYTDTYTSIDISQSLSNLEYPPSAMNNYSTYLITTYGAGTYTASASTIWNTSYLPWFAFDKTITSTGWASGPVLYNASTGAYIGTVVTYDVNNVGYLGEWLQIQMPNSILLNSYALSGTAATAEYPKTWYVLGSTDGVNWTLLNTQTNNSALSSSIYQFFGISNTTNWYSYYRLVVNVIRAGTAAQDCAIGEWRLFTNTALGLNRYPKYKATIPYYTSTNTYGLGQYQVWANTIQDYSFSNQLVPSGLFNKTVGNTSNTVWASYSNVYTSTVDAVSSNLPIIYAQFPDALQVTSYSLTSRGGNALETPSKWTLFGSNTALTSPWQSVDTESGIANWQPFQTSNFTVSTTTAYNFYKLELYRNSSPVPTRMSLGELRFYANKQTPESRISVSTNGFVGIGFSNASQTMLINGDINISGVVGDPILNIGPNVVFDGSSNAKNTFLTWLQYITSMEYRYALQPRSIQNCWWATNMNVSLYESYTYSTVAITSPGAGAYAGGVLTLDGRVVFIPFNANVIGLFSPTTNSYTTIPATGLSTNTTAYLGGLLIPDGRIIFVPYGSTGIGIFNPSTNIYTTLSLGSAGLHSGGVLLPDGRVLFGQTNSANIGFFNPTTNTYTTFNTGNTGTNLFEGCVLLSDGRVVFVPRAATYIGIYNSINNTYSTITGAPGSGAYAGGVLLSDGRVLFIPYNGTAIGIFNPVTNIYSTIAGSGSGSYFGAVLSPDGRAIFVPHSATTFSFFNSTTNTYTTASGAPGTGAYVGGILLPDGRIVFIPAYAATVGILTPTQLPRPPPLELCYHPCFNKY